MEYKILNILRVFVISLVFGLSFLASSCNTIFGSATTAHTVTDQAIDRFVPPSYYACIQTDINTLCAQYFTHYGNLDAAEQAYNGVPFVFPNVLVTVNMILDANTLEISTCQFSAMYPGDVGKLKVGQRVDVIGINSGPLPLIEGTPIASWFNKDGTPVIATIPNGGLLFTGCLFLTGDIGLPAPGAPAFTSLY